MPTFLELSLILVLATLVALCMRVLRQPLVVGYIATGIIIGPSVFNILHSREEMELFSKIGVSILLFIVGLTLNPDIVREVGKPAFVTGIGQIVFTSIIGFFIMRLLGFDVSASFYAAIALTFSSTIIILKLLTDRGDVGKLYGKISIGFLLVQDLVATIILLVVTVVGATVAPSALAGRLSFELARILIVGGIITYGLYIISKRFLPRFIAFVGGNQEVLFVFSIAWGLGFASLFYAIGFSIEIGALIAGVMLAVSPFAYEIGSRMKPLRDFFILIFFILLGAQMMLGQIGAILIPAIILSLFVLIGNPLIVFVLMNLLGYRTRTSFMAGLTVAQISEFSFILVALGFSLGHVSETFVSLVTLVGIITIAGSTYLILYADPIYAKMKPFLNMISIRKRHTREDARVLGDAPDAVIFGYDRVGHEFVSVASKLTPRYLVVDFNPQSICRLEREQIPFRYGDAEDLEFLHEIGLIGARLVVSSIPDHKTNLLLVRYYRKRNPQGVIIVIAHRKEDAEELYAAGASYVVMPHHLGAHHAALMIGRYGFNASGFAVERNTHLSRLSRGQSEA